MSEFDSTEQDRREWGFVCFMLVGALAVLGGLIAYGERVLGAAW